MGNSQDGAVRRSQHPWKALQMQLCTELCSWWGAGAKGRSGRGSGQAQPQPLASGPFGKASLPPTHGCLQGDESDEMSPEVSPVSPSDGIPLRVGKRKGSPGSPWDPGKLAPQGLLELSGGLSRGDDSASAQVMHTSAGTPPARGCSSVSLSCAQGRLHTRTTTIVLITSNLFLKLPIFWGWDWCTHLVTHWQDRQGQAGDSDRTQAWKTREAESMSLPWPGRKNRQCPLDLKHQTGTAWIRAGCFLRHKKLNQNKAPSDTFTNLTTIKKKKKGNAQGSMSGGLGQRLATPAQTHMHTPLPSLRLRACLIPVNWSGENRQPVPANTGHHESEARFAKRKIVYKQKQAEHMCTLETSLVRYI